MSTFLCNGKEIMVRGLSGYKEENEELIEIFKKAFISSCNGDMNCQFISPLHDTEN